MVAEIYEFDIKHHSLNMYGHCVRENCPNRPEGEQSEPEGDGARDKAGAPESTNA
jgi:Fur family ferric uptake transcriptional regulator